MSKTMGEIMAEALKAGEKPDHDAMIAAMKKQMPMACNIVITSHTKNS